MELMSREEVARTVAFMESVLRRLDQEPELAAQLAAGMEERPLSKQPEETPRQRYERLFHGNGAIHG